MDDGRYLVVHVELPELPRDAPTATPLQGFETLGVLVVSDATGTMPTTLGYIGTGTIHVDRVRARTAEQFRSTLALSSRKHWA